MITINVSKIEKKGQAILKNTEPKISLKSFPLRNVHVYDLSKFVFNYNSMKNRKLRKLKKKQWFMSFVFLEQISFVI